MFKQEENRFNDYSLTFENQILVDFSKNKINQETLKLLRQLAKESALDEAINAMFAGEKINRTENRAVLHTALRNRSNTPVYVDGKDVMPEVIYTLWVLQCMRCSQEEFLLQVNLP